MAIPIVIQRRLFKFSGLAYAFLHLPYRQLEGFLQALSGFVPGLRSADYTTLWQRISTFELNFPIPDNDIVVAVDSTGMKVTSRGDWMREKHGVERKGWIKVHVAVDVETRKPITFEITDERITDQEMVKPLLKDIRLKDALMDGAYDKEKVFKFIKGKGVKMPGIKIRKNAVVKADTERAESVLECCDFVASSLDEIEAFRSMATIAGKECTNMVEDGPQMVFSQLLSGSSERLLGLLR